LPSKESSAKPEEVPKVPSPSTSSSESQVSKDNSPVVENLSEKPHSEVPKQVRGSQPDSPISDLEPISPTPLPDTPKHSDDDFVEGKILGRYHLLDSA